ncbi:MAG: leucine--tRNA ligase [Bacteroidales bacterium]|nr:leucine--tRNA ligase [Bacteroidales bacterium]
MEYNFGEVEKKWQKQWAAEKIFKTEIVEGKPKYYVLDMFPYPSGAGLHVGHPLGYIASDIFSRYKRLKGFNVLHPMGYDAYGLPAEQYAIQTGTHPAVTTEINLARYREQLDKIGFSFDWDREVRTCDPGYYKWTQWTFIQLFNSWYNKKTNKAEAVSELVSVFGTEGNASVQAASNETPVFSASEWNAMSEKQQQEILMHYRLAYLAETAVNWCPALGTVLANDEVSEGHSVRGGHPVERKKMKQWLLRITAYADRLLAGLNTIDWTESIKEIQRNWIGRSEGGSMRFALENHKDIDPIEVFTTRPDTIFGATFMVLAPEHELVSKITTPEHREKIDAYVSWAKNRTERERMTEVKKVSGEFTGAYAINPFTNLPIPIWIADYVLMGYGTGAIMAVPAHDSRDFAFARHFSLPIVQVVNKPGHDATDPATWEESFDSKEGILINSGFIDGLHVKQAISAVIRETEKLGIGTGKINFRLRDAIFSRQRYWGEPFPVFYKDGMPYTLPEDKLPLLLPDVDAYLPTESGEPPLARAKNWITSDGYPLETNTMPGFAGSSGYYLRYMDPRNDKEYFSKEAVNYWQSVDLYIGGAEHATGHLLYSRFWNKFLFDLGYSVVEEPFKKLINQGMIQGRSSFVYRVKGTNTFVSNNLRQQYDVQQLHVDVNIVENDILDTDKFRTWRPDFAEAEFILEDGKYHCGWEVEKMSKSMHNVVNPDILIERYGADTLRLYEMFLGPLEQAKPWDTSGIEGVFRFIRKFWRLFNDSDNNFLVSDETPNAAELKVLHKTIKKIQDDTERISFNTAVSSFMICVNELTELKCNKRAILNELVILVSPYAPHIAEELWQLLGNTGNVCNATFPEYNATFTADNSFAYPVSFNGKTRFTLELPIDMPVPEIEKAVLQAPEAQKWLGGVAPKKVIIVPKKIVNIVI